MEKTVQTGARWPAKVHRRLVRSARAYRFSVNAYIVLATVEKMDRDQELRKQAALQAKAGGAG